MHLVRSVPGATYSTRYDMWARHGTRLASAFNPDSAYVVEVTTGPQSPPVRVAVVGEAGFPGLAWSPDGRKLAVGYTDASNNYRATARVFEIDANGAVTSAGPALDLGGKADQIENLVWLPDASALLLLNWDDAPGGTIVLRPLDPARPPVRFATDVNAAGSFFLEPGGRSVVFQSRGPSGATIWTADFLPVKKQ